MLTQLDVYSPNIFSAPYTLDSDGSIESDPFQITNVDGLGPVDAAINSSKLGNIPGEAFTGSNVGKRNIVLTVKLNPDWATQTVESLRHILNTQFAPESPVRLVFTSTELAQRVQINGHVETVTPNIFSSDPECQVSIVCTYPYFTDVTPQVIAGVTGTGIDIDYIGTAATGFVLTIPTHNFSDTYSRATIFMTQSGNQSIWSCDAVLLGRHRAFEMSTVDGNKYAVDIFDAPLPAASALSRVPTSSVWTKIKPGRNNFFLAYSNDFGVALPWSLTYYNRWVGL